ncbi:MAG: SDR family oxidoreductase [Deltaproteobacteria bacterium]|nr:SDR family oxidoreductase [Deltaproteobacteria bacterium]MBW2659606.1 SDR family oxidoreductase [Deltaproteobacteria bacterium]
MHLRNKTVLIPGASRPVGRAIARRFGKEGAFLILPCYDWPEDTAEMKEEFQQAGFSFHTRTTDLRIDSEVQQLAEEIKKRTGHLDFLINNIERGGMPVVHGSYDLEHNKNQWNLEVETTLKAKWLLYHHCLPLMLHHPNGAVVNISSISAITGRSGPAAQLFSDGFSAANRAVQSFTESWAREAAPDIRVNELMIGLIESRHGPGTRGWEALTERETEAILDHIPLKRIGHPDEIADAVFFLAVEARYMTGSTLRMDGGFILGGEKFADMPPGLL